MEKDNQTTEVVQSLAVYMSDSGHFTNTEDLLKQSLAWANQLEGLVDSSMNVSQADDVELVMEEDELQALSVLQDPTAAQSEQPFQSAQSYGSHGGDSADQVDSDQSWAQVWLQRGLSKLKQENFEGAQDNFERVLQKMPHCVEAFNGLGIAQYCLADLASSVAALRRAIQIEATQPMLYCNLGAVLYKAGDFANAISAFQKAARLSPREVAAYYGLGVSLIQHQDYSKAIAAFQRAVALNSQDAKSYYGLSYVHYRLGDLPAAIAALGKAKQRNPEYEQRYETFLQHCLQQEHPIIRR
jgi:tetratricopeptide (TPR) repeat protein